MIELKHTTETPEQRAERLLRLPSGSVASVDVSAHENGLTYAATLATGGVLLRTCGLNWWDPAPVQVATRRLRHEDTADWEKRTYTDAERTARGLGWKAWAIDGPHFGEGRMRATVTCLPDPAPRPPAPVTAAPTPIEEEVSKP